MERQPIRLRVTYKTARALLTEYTTSVSRGGCTIKSRAALETGATFIFELTAEGMERRCLEIEGKVVHATPRPDGEFDLGIQYLALSSPRRVAMTRFLDHVFAEQLAKRNHARVPVNILADDADDETRYLIRDLSRGGMGVRLSGSKQPTIGARVDVVVVLDGDIPFELSAEVVRVDPGSDKRPPSVGLRFQELTEAQDRLIHALLYLHRPQLVQLRFHP